MLTMEKPQNGNQERTSVSQEELVKEVARLFGPVESPDKKEMVQGIHDSHKLPLIVRNGQPIISTFDYPPERVKYGQYSFKTGWTENLPTREVQRGQELQKARMYYLYEPKRLRVLIEIIYSHSPYHVTEFEWGEPGEAAKVRLWQRQAGRDPEPEHIEYLQGIVKQMQAEYSTPKPI